MRGAVDVVERRRLLVPVEAVVPHLGLLAFQRLALLIAHLHFRDDLGQLPQLLLNVARQSGLRQQRRVGLVEILEQRLLDGGDVIDAFGNASRQFLEPRKPVEFERLVATVRRLLADRK